jgi:hypothetical protein
MSFIATMLSKCHLIFIKKAMKHNERSEKVTDSDVKLKEIRLKDNS